MPFGSFAPMPLRLGGNAQEGWSPNEHARFAADLVAVTRVSRFAELRFDKSGATVVVRGYLGRNGAGLAYAPSSAVLGTGVVKFTWPATHDDPYGNPVSPAFRSGIARINGSTTGRATVTIAANSVTVRTFDSTGAAADLSVSVTVWGEAGVNTRAIGDYAGSPDKRESRTEGQIPYAAQWYEEFKALRGDAYTQSSASLVHCENLALARLWADWASRFPEKIRANAHPGRSDDKLPYWVEVLGVPTRDDDPKWLIRKRCAAHYKAAKGPTLPVIREVLAELLGDTLIDVIQTEGVGLYAPPSPTYWPGVNPGPPSYDLGGGTWMSRRCHLLVVVRRSSQQDLGRFLQLVNVDMFRLLDTLLSAWATFAWVVFDTDDGFSGFFLDSSPMDLTGLTDP